MANTHTHWGRNTLAIDKDYCSFCCRRCTFPERQSAALFSRFPLLTPCSPPPTLPFQHICINFRFSASIVWSPEFYSHSSRARSPSLCLCLKNSIFFQTISAVFLALALLLCSRYMYTGSITGKGLKTNRWITLG